MLDPEFRHLVGERQISAVDAGQRQRGAHLRVVHPQLVAQERCDPVRSDLVQLVHALQDG